jgi:hypothetical protein
MLPNFIIVGAMKAGTTTFHEYLSEGEGVFMPRPELKFFSTDADYARGMDWYESFFAGSDSKVAVGERTTTYSYVPSVAERIHRHLPDVKLIWIFREPVSRTYSHYWHSAKAGSETLSFEQAIARESERIKKDIFRGYAKRSLYAEQVERYLRYFSKEQMLFLLFEDFLREPANVLNRTLKFLNVDAIVRDPGIPKQNNPSYAPRYLHLQWAARKLFDKSKPFRLVTRINRSATPGYPRMSEHMRARLRETFREPNQQLAELTRLNLAIWDTPVRPGKGRADERVAVAASSSATEHSRHSR